MHKILIVEDEFPIAQMYDFKLQQNGFLVRTAFDGDEGFKVAQEFQPHLILLDLKMPRVNGDEMLVQLRQQDWGSNIKVIVLTNISRVEAPPILRILNVDRYIVKAHHTPSQVVSIVHEILKPSLTI